MVIMPDFSALTVTRMLVKCFHREYIKKSNYCTVLYSAESDTMRAARHVNQTVMSECFPAVSSSSAASVQFISFLSILHFFHLKTLNTPNQCVVWNWGTVCVCTNTADKKSVWYIEMRLTTTGLSVFFFNNVAASSDHSNVSSNMNERSKSGPSFNEESSLILESLRLLSVIASAVPESAQVHPHPSIKQELGSRQQPIPTGSRFLHDRLFQ